MPHEVAAILDAVGSVRPATIGVHFHDDTGCAVANTLVGVEHGAVHVQGTVNGIGERCGNANILTIAANLTLKMGLPVLSDEQLATLTPAHFAVAEICNIAPDPHQPYVGASAFATKAGLHTSGLAKMEGAYEHIDPGRVGNARRLLVSELSGRSTIVMKGRELGLDLEKDADVAAAILAGVGSVTLVGLTIQSAVQNVETPIEVADKFYGTHFGDIYGWVTGVYSSR